MARATYVYDVLQDKVVPIEERTDSPEIKIRRSANIMSDIEPYQSIETGEMIGSRSHHREHLKRNNLVELGNERVKGERKSVGGAAQDIAQTWNNM